MRAQDARIGQLTAEKHLLSPKAVLASDGRRFSTDRLVCFHALARAMQLRLRSHSIMHIPRTMGYRAVLVSSPCITERIGPWGSDGKVQLAERKRSWLDGQRGRGGRQIEWMRGIGRNSHLRLQGLISNVMPQALGQWQV
jgi:hypothetical protein